MSTYTEQTTNDTKPVYVLRNAIKCPDGTVLNSRSRWEYLTHIDAVSGETYMVDSGKDLYRRRSVNIVPYVDMTVTTLDAFELQREAFEWGTYGKDGTGPRTLVVLKDMTDEHIRAVISTQSRIHGTYVEELFWFELGYRLLNNIEIKD